VTDTVPPQRAGTDATALAAHLAAVPGLRDRLGGRTADWRVDEIGDGNVNFVYRVRGPAGTLCVKQAPPYVRVAGDSWPLTPERAVHEYRALEEHGRAAPGALPAPLHLDRTRHLLVLEYVEGHTVLRHRLAGGHRHPGLGEQVGDYLARTLFATSDLALPAADKRALVAEFETNTEMCKIMEDMVFTEVYTDFHRNRWTTPHLDGEVARIRADTRVAVAASRLKNRYLTSREALLHGDLHTGSVMVGESGSRVFDHEFACFGPMGFDVGGFLAHLFIAYFAADGRRGVDGDASPEDVQQVWLLETVEATWNVFRERFLSLWRASGRGDAYPPALFGGADGAAALEAERGAYLDRVFGDSVGFCGAELMRRLIGFARPDDLTGITDPAARAACERGAMRLARSLLVDHAEHRTVRDLTDAARNQRRG
jgi:5-methylthioribose kinase